MTGNAGEDRLRTLEAQLALDDPAFVQAFRSRASAMPDALRIRTRLRLVVGSLTCGVAALTVVLLVIGAYATALALGLLVLLPQARRRRRP